MAESSQELFVSKTNENENRSKISVSAESKEEADKLFNGLSVNGQVEVPIGDSPWSSYFGILETNTELNGLLILIQNIIGKFNRRKRSANT